MIIRHRRSYKEGISFPSWSSSIDQGGVDFRADAGFLIRLLRKSRKNLFQYVLHLLRINPKEKMTPFL
jgi:hypothetical protein